MESLVLIDREVSVLLIDEEIEEKKIKILKFLRKVFNIFLDVNGYIDGSGFFDEVFIEVVSNLE